MKTVITMTIFITTLFFVSCDPVDVGKDLAIKTTQEQIAKLESEVQNWKSKAGSLEINNQKLIKEIDGLRLHLKEVQEGFAAEKAAWERILRRDT